MNLNLVAVQARMTLADYADGAAFRRKIGALAEQAVMAANPDYPTLVVFPEGSALTLGFGPFNWARGGGATSLAQAARALAPVLPGLAWRAVRRRVWSPSIIAVEHAVAAEAIYRETFSEGAARHRIYVGAGSMFLPYVDHDPIGGSRVLDRRARATSYTFGPTGTLLGRTHKVHFAPGLEARLGLTPGAAESLQPMQTAMGNIGVLICMDGFYNSLWERMDGLGTHVLAMPSYEMSHWEQASWLDPQIRQGEQWLRDGMPTLIQGRENICYGLNPMLGGGLGTCFDVALLREGGMYRMWFSWRPRKSIALVESRDGVHWGESRIALGPNPATEGRTEDCDDRTNRERLAHHRGQPGPRPG